MQLNDYKKQILLEIKEYFGGRVRGFSTSEKQLSPILSIKMDFIVYEYFHLAFEVERSKAGFGIKEGAIGIPLITFEVPALNDCGGKRIIEKNVLALLDDKVRLRIPDKYLEKEDWK